MHILEIPSFFIPNGGEFCLEQAKAIHKQGDVVRILAVVQISITINKKEYFYLPFRSFEEELEGIKIYKKYIRFIPKVNHLNMKLWCQKVLSMFDRYIKKYGKPDIIHAHCAKWAGYVAMNIKERYNIPYVITEHLSILLLESEFKEKWQIPLLSRVYRQANMVVPVAAQAIEQTKIFYGDNFKWKEISNIIDNDFFAFKQRESKPINQFAFCCIAHYNYCKGYDVLLPAFDEVCREYPNCQLHIAGRFFDHKDFIRLLENCTHKQNIVIHHELNKIQVRELLYQSDAFVLASRSELQPLTVLEAMSTGIPVVSTEIIPPSIRHNKKEYFVPIDNIEALSSAMRRMIKERNTFDDKELSQIVKDLASPEIIGKKLHDLFNDIV